jgi:hypothetical protein
MPLSAYTKRIVAQKWMFRGGAFLAAANLLGVQRQNSEDALMVSLHLLCQGMELFLKGLLSDKDYDLYYPKLKSFGHRLDFLADEVTKIYSAPMINAQLRCEFLALVLWYSRHWFRHESGLGFVAMSGAPSYFRTLRRMLAVVRVSRRSQTTP